jgi:hypothetical protein
MLKRNNKCIVQEGWTKEWILVVGTASRSRNGSSDLDNCLWLQIEWVNDKKVFGEFTVESEDLCFQT